MTTEPLPTVAGMYHRGWREEIRQRGYGGVSWRIASGFYALLGRLYLAQQPPLTSANLRSALANIRQAMGGNL